MKPFIFLHRHPQHRSRQLRWIVPLAVLLGATLLTLAVQYSLSGHDVQVEFFRAHKTISNTAQLLRRGMLVGSAILLLAALGIGWWVLHMTHRIVRPVHSLHRALEEITTGDLGVRVEFHATDEFQEVGDALNRLVAEFGATLHRSHELTDRIVGLAEEAVSDPHDEGTGTRLRECARELDRTMEFFRLGPLHVVCDDRS